MHYETLESISNSIRSRQRSSSEVVAHQLARIEQLDPTLRAFCYVDSAAAQQRAAELDAELWAGSWRGPLHGVPIAVKDIYGIEGQPFEVGMPSRRGQTAKATATVVDRLLDAGAIVLGRLNLTEGVYAEHTPPFAAPRNPWNLDHWVGSSSSGSGVAAAAGLAHGVLGSDTGGSIRIPASCNGVTGLKPTWGRCSRYGAFELAATLDHPGPMARSAIDAGIMLEAMSGYDPRDPTSSQQPCLPTGTRAASGRLHELRIGVDFDWALTDSTRATQEAVQEAIAVFRGLGVEIVPMTFPDTEQIVADWFKVCGVQTAYAHDPWFAQHRDTYGPALTELINIGNGVSGAEYQELLLRRMNFKGEAMAVLKHVDAMLIPGLPFEAPPAVDMAVMDAKKVSDVHRYTVPFTMSGLPTLTMPGGFSESPKLPVSVQLVGGEFAEPTLVRLGAAFQSATTWHGEHPDVQ